MEDLIGFVQRFMNQAASRPADRMELQVAVQNGRLLKTERGGTGSHHTQKKGLLQALSPFFGGGEESIRQITPLVLTRKLLW